MSAAEMTALIGSITALVAAIGGIVALFKHQTGPQHADPTQPPPPHG